MESLELRTERDDLITLRTDGDLIDLRVATALGVGPSPCLMKLAEAEGLQKLLTKACARLRGHAAQPAR